MKKTLIAIAALAATAAFAQSTVTIDGLLDSGYVDINYKGAKVSGITQGIAGTTQINFRGTSDLGGGLKASFRFESDFNSMSNAGNTGAGTNLAPSSSTAVTAAAIAAMQAQGGTGATASGYANNRINNGAAGTFGNGELFLAIEGGLGKVSVGAVNNVGLDHVGASQPFGTAIGSAYGAAVFTKSLDSVTASSVRNDNSIKYSSPTMDGFRVDYLARKQQAASSSYGNTNFNNATFGTQQQSQVSQLGLNYSKGPLVVQVSKTSEDATNTIGVSASPATGAYYATPGLKGIQTSLAANYNMGALTIMGGTQSTKQNTALVTAWRDTTYTNVAAKYVMGVNTFMANAGRLTAAMVSGGAVSSGASVLGLGYSYALSKTASINARYESIKDDGVNALVGSPTGITAGTETARTRMGLGLQLAF